jgi:hypothetical protein
MLVVWLIEVGAICRLWELRRCPNYKFAWIRKACGRQTLLRPESWLRLQDFAPAQNQTSFVALDRSQIAKRTPAKHLERSQAIARSGNLRIYREAGRFFVYEGL